jgi:hypothetical protein
MPRWMPRSIRRRVRPVSNVRLGLCRKGLDAFDADVARGRGVAVDEEFEQVGAAAAEVENVQAAGGLQSHHRVESGALRIAAGPEERTKIRAGPADGLGVGCEIGGFGTGRHRICILRVGRPAAMLSGAEETAKARGREEGREAETFLMR